MQPAQAMPTHYEGRQHVRRTDFVSATNWAYECFNVQTVLTAGLRSSLRESQ